MLSGMVGGISFAELAGLLGNNQRNEWDVTTLAQLTSRATRHEVPTCTRQVLAFGRAFVVTGPNYAGAETGQQPARHRTLRSYFEAATNRLRWLRENTQTQSSHTGLGNFTFQGGPRFLISPITFS
jgi:hypothetical protein